LLANAGEREKMGRRGCELSKSYDWRAIAACYLELYQSLLATEHRPYPNRRQMNSAFLHVPSKS
jgi:hypothetical protein